MTGVSQLDRTTASYLLAVATTSVFPDAKLIEIYTDDVFFGCSFSFPFSMQEDFISLIEERMKQIIKETPNFRKFEMVLASAKAYLSSKNALWLLDYIDETQPLIPFLEHEGRPFLCYEAILEDFNLPHFFHLFKTTSNKDEIFTIEGVIAQDKQQLKELIKKIKKGKKNTHFKLGEQFQLFSKIHEDFFWHPNGVALKEKLIDTWKRESKNHLFNPIYTPWNEELNQTHIEYALSVNKDLPFKSFEIKQLLDQSSHNNDLFDQERFLQTINSIVCMKDEILEECISSLHFIQKISTILELNGKYVLFASHDWRRNFFIDSLEEAKFDYFIENSVGNSFITFQLHDCFGRNWDVSSLFIHEIDKKRCQIAFSVFSSVERMIALMVENRNINR